MSKLPKGRVSMTLEARNFFNRFLHNESVGGILLLICAIISLVCANVPELNFLHEIWKQDAGITVGNFSLNMKIEHWINDGLLAIFFFVVGLVFNHDTVILNEIFCKR